MMNEKEWLACTNTTRIHNWLARGVLPREEDDRKSRLFACAWCRFLKVEQQDELLRTAVEVAERFADGLATEEELAAVHAPLLERPRPWSRAEGYACRATTHFAMN